MARGSRRRDVAGFWAAWLLVVATPAQAMAVGSVPVPADGSPPPSPIWSEGPVLSPPAGLRTPVAPPFLFTTGTPSTNPYDVCGDCYSWSSSFYQSATNYDLSARRFSVPLGSFGYSFRVWWAYGSEGPYDPFRNRGGTASDFSRISVDLYDEAPGGGPGDLIVNLSGIWTLLNSGTHYREIQLDSPYVFADSVYYFSLRAETSRPDYEAVILWLGCAPHDQAVDYENARNGFWTSDGWDPYTEDNRPYSPCHQDMDFGLQVLGFTVPDGVDGIPLEPCVTTGCATVAFDFHRLDPTPMRGFSVTFELSSNLILCDDPDSIREGTYLPGIGSTSFQVIPLGNGRYTVDSAILGSPCGAVGVGNLFTIKAAKKTGEPDGTGQITVLSALARDCGNHPIPAGSGLPASLVIDSQAPEAATAFTARQIKTGNNPPPPQPPREVTQIELQFTLPPDAAAFEVYRAPFGNFPEYDDLPNPGSPPLVPSYPPTFPWSLLPGVTTIPALDRPLTRDFYYYAAFVKDACGNVSPAALAKNPLLAAPAPGTLNYHLGDVSTGMPPLCSGNNLVFLEDLSLLGAHYGVSEPDPLYLNCIDVGPTADGTVDSRPLTDNSSDFEDLMIFAQNFDQVRAKNDAVLPVGGSPGETGTIPGGRLRLQLQWDEPVPGPVSPSPEGTARLLLSGGGRRVKGIHAEIGFDPKHWELESAEPGTLLTEGGFALSYDVARGCVFDAAAMGGATTLPEDGEVAILRFRARALTHDAAAGSGLATRIATEPSSLDPPELWRYELRGGDNRSLTLDDSPAPATDLLLATGAPPASDPQSGAGRANRGISFLEARPNPTAGSTEIRLVLSRTIHTEVRIHDVTGRAVKALRRGVMPAGEHSLRWDGTGPHGRRCGSGTYFCVIRTPDDMRVVKLHLIE